MATRPASRAFDLAISQPWLITEPALRELLDIIERRNDLEAVIAQRGAPLTNTRTVDMREGGVAVIPVTGPIFRYANLFTEISGATSTEVLAQDFAAALDNPNVRAIVLDINSPGGAATGINELADMIRAGRDAGQKPIVAYAGGMMASAAYWLGSAAGEIVIDETAIVGSIGAVVTVEDDSERRAKSGVRTYQVVSRQSPNKRLDPGTDAGQAALGQIVDDLAAVFIAKVADNRGVSTAVVERDFGQGGVFTGEGAIGAGLADKIGSLETVIAGLAEATSNRRSFMATQRGAQVKGPIVVATTAALRAAMEAGHTAEEISVAEPDVAKIGADAGAAALKDAEAAHAEAVASAKTEGHAEGVKAGQKAERERIAALQKVSMKGLEKELAAAIEDGSTPGDFAVKQAEIVNTRGSSMASLRAGAPAPVPHGGADGGKATGGSWSKITARLNGKRKTG